MHQRFFIVICRIGNILLEITRKKKCIKIGKHFFVQETILRKTVLHVTTLILNHFKFVRFQKQKSNFGRPHQGLNSEKRGDRFHKVTKKEKQRISFGTVTNVP